MTYSALEIALSTHSANPAISTTYDPSLLARGPALTADITHLLTLLPPSSEEATTFAAPSESTPLPPFPLPAFLSPIFTKPEPALSDFLIHIEDLATSTGKAPLLLAHAYVRYLGDLSGGQIIGGRIRRAYKLPSTAGTAFYDFSDKGERSGFESDKTGEGGRKRLMDIKDWYRRGMNDGVGEDKDLKGEWKRPLSMSR
jgi:heme oxygenase